jgi:hypothetical protein
MSYELAEREGIMADSGMSIDEAFEDTERWRIETEARHALEFYSLEERRKFLDHVEKWRGKVGRKCMEKAIRQEWERRKAE